MITPFRMDRSLTSVALVRRRVRSKARCGIPALPREDLLSPEDIPWFRLVRQQCATPMAMGELFNSPHEWTQLMAERLIDYIRIHISQAGGLTPCRKIAALGEYYGVKTAWHGPGRRRLPGGPRLQRHARRGGPQFRHPGILALQRAVAGGLPGLPGDEGRLPVPQRRSGLGHRAGGAPGAGCIITGYREPKRRFRLNKEDPEYA